MARIPLSGGYSVIPEGTYVFRIYEVNYNEEFGKIEVKLVTAKGKTHTERFSIKNKDDSFNDGALNAFSYLAKTAMGDYELEDIDPNELVDHYIEAEVKHSEVPSKNDPNKMVVFANLGNKAQADGFEETPVKRAMEMGRSETKVEPKEETKGLDLDALLGE